MQPPKPFAPALSSVVSQAQLELPLRPLNSLNTAASPGYGDGVEPPSPPSPNFYEGGPRQVSTPEAGRHGALVYIPGLGYHAAPPHTWNPPVDPTQTAPFEPLQPVGHVSFNPQPTSPRHNRLLGGPLDSRVRAFSRGLLCDSEIAGRCTTENLIHPFVDHQIREINGQRVVSYGLSSAGYDLQLSPHFKLANTAPSVTSWILDPKDAVHPFIDLTTGKPLIIPPHGFVLGSSVETVTMPRDLMGVVLGKSSYARIGLLVNVTPIEPGFIGTITIEITNTTNLPVRVYPLEGIGQVLFLTCNPCHISYADRAGKYQHQSGVTLARV